MSNSKAGQEWPKKAPDLRLLCWDCLRTRRTFPKLDKVGPQISADRRYLRPNSLHVSAAVALAGGFGFAILLA
jgi:hypothetical protein